ncbi:hypothetical protein Ancab_024839 [Ancistrocladus abbreviatus]
MHARHRSPGHGYKSNAMGMGMTTSRISPDASTRSSHGGCNSDNRNFSRSFGRGRPKIFQSLQPLPTLLPPSQRGDLFFEAGRLAVEYLVSQGLLPPDVLSSKYQDGSLKRTPMDMQDLRSQGGENVNSLTEGQSTATGRLGNAIPDVFPGRRRSPNDYGSTGSRNSIRERRKFGSSRSYSSDWSRGNGRGSGSWSDKASATKDMQSDNDIVSARGDPKEAHGNFHRSLMNEFAAKVDEMHGLLEETECHPSVDVDPGIISCNSAENLSIKSSEEAAKGSDLLNAEYREIGNGSNGDIEKQVARDLGNQHCEEEADTKSNNGPDLLKLCSSAKVPTRIRSSLTNRSLEIDSPSVVEEIIVDNTVPAGGLILSVQANLENGPAGTALPNESRSCLDSGCDSSASTHPEGDAGRLDSADAVEQENCVKPQSLLDAAFMHEQRLTERLPELGSSSSITNDRGEKRTLGDEGGREGTKKPKEWLSVSTNCGHFQLSEPKEKQLNSQEEMASSCGFVMKPTAKESSTSSELSKSGDDPSDEYIEEKQLFPNAFKICDLNLMEASDINENHDDPILIYPSIAAANNEVPVDIDLSISNNCNLINEYSKFGATGKEIEVIDLGTDSLHEDRSFNNSTRKMQDELTSLERFPNHDQMLHDPHAQDGYGLMISELIGTDIPDGSSVQPEIDSLHNEMGLHQNEGLLNDDDQIYMQLGEIPIKISTADASGYLRSVCTTMEKRVLGCGIWLLLGGLLWRCNHQINLVMWN